MLLLLTLIGLAITAVILMILHTAHRSAQQDWSAYDDAGIPVICSRCHTHLRGPAPTPVRPISDGLCPACAYAQARKEIEALQKLNNASRLPDSIRTPQSAIK